MTLHRVKKYQGIWFPASEVHLLEMVDKVPKVDGKGAYQYHKYVEALKWIEERGTVIDVGGHIGFWSMHFKKDFQQVYAFEPVELYRYCFFANVFEKEPGFMAEYLGVPASLENCTLYPYALTDTPQMVKMCNPQPDSTGDTWVQKPGMPIERVNKFKTHASYRELPPFDPTGLVQARTIDSYNFQNVSFIKIDCEGFEYFVLKGAEETLRRCKPVVIVEQKPTLARKYGLGDRDGVKYLESLGAKLRRNMANDFLMSWGD